MNGAFLILLVLAAEPAGDAAKAAGTATATSSAAAPAVPAKGPPGATDNLPAMVGTPVRIENRILVKERKFFVTGGLSYLSRGDYWIAPGVSAAASFFPSEGHGLEAKLDVFVAWMAPGAVEIYNATGLIPDAHRPFSRFSVGYRNAIAYGKVMAFGSQLVHFELHGAGHLGALFTDRGAAPSVSVGPGLLVRLGPSLYAQLDVPLFMSFEQRESGLFSIGSLPTFTIGIRP